MLLTVIYFNMKKGVSYGRKEIERFEAWRVVHIKAHRRAKGHTSLYPWRVWQRKQKIWVSEVFRHQRRTIYQGQRNGFHGIYILKKGVSE